MHIKKSTLMKCCLLLVIVVAVLACMRSLRELNYKTALSIMENYQYELAEEQFLAMDGYRDSEELAAEMVRLTEFNQKQIQKLLPVPEFDAENQYEVTYRCGEAGIGMQIGWYIKNGPDLYAQWGNSTTVTTNSNAADEFFKNTEKIEINLVRYDEVCEEYLFIQSVTDNISDISTGLPTTVLYRGKLNADGTLELHNDEGEHFVFVPHSYYDMTNQIKKVIN